MIEFNVTYPINFGSNRSSTGLSDQYRIGTRTGQTWNYGRFQP